MLTAEAILEKKGHDIVSVSPDTTIRDALKFMLSKNIGSILVKEGDKFVGIWTERDLMRNTLDENFDPNTAKIKDYMVTGLKSAPHTDSIYQLMDRFLGMRLRHLLIEKKGKYIGLLSIGDVSKANLIKKTEEIEKLNQMVSWRYYEDWKWKKKKY